MTTIQPIYYRVGRQIALRRHERGLSQAKLAKLIGVDRVTLAKWEIGQQRFNLHHLERIAELLQVPITEFFKEGHYAERQRRDIPKGRISRLDNRELDRR